MALSYQLAVLTHGRSRTLAPTLASFLDKVKPHQERVLVHTDGPRQGDFSALNLLAEQRFDSEQRGFCGATGKLWKWAGTPDDDQAEFTFWLEHDFVFLRPVDLDEIAAVLNADKTLAQMQLMRGPVSREEIAAGGLYEMRQDDYEAERVGAYNIDASVDAALDGWLRHRAYFTTNPSLMRTEFMTWNQWPNDDEGQCEGRFGLDLVRRGFSFGVWGAGEPWVDHIGRRDGTGTGY